MEHIPLTDVEKELIVAFNANESMREAVKKVLLAGIYYNGVIIKGQKHEPRRNWALSLANVENPNISNEQLGADLKSYAWAINAIETAYLKMSEFKIAPLPKEKPKNQAR